ncbi:MAG: AI-2E family transporter [Bacteroidales bacterium]|jgi:predicted PurR-regulated permease PerM|nr:AI-2E family transporter [Bacteroidales bacterium]
MNPPNSELIKSTKHIEKLLLIIVVISTLAILKLLSYIFVPLVAASLLALVFMPMMRWFAKKNISNWLAMPLVIIILCALVGFFIFLVQISSREISSVDMQFWYNSLERINHLLVPLFNMLGFEHVSHHDISNYILNHAEVSSKLYSLLGTVLNVTQRTLIMLAMTLFYVILLLSGSINMRKIMQTTIFNRATPAARTFVILEKSISKFLIVKFLISLGTGIAVCVSCLAFNVQFPFFWGILTFVANFIQMFGSIASTTLLSLFALSQIDSTGTAFTLIALLIAIQIVFGSILEPIFMGKAFSINTITVLIMLMFWGYMWGVIGMILSVPITVVIKTVLSQSVKYKIVSDLMG